MTVPGREGLEVEALRTDRYLEALLAAADRRADDVPADSELDPAIRGAATRLATELMRVHPSFRFEERLAARLAEAARSMQLAAAAGGESLPVGLPTPFRPSGALEPPEVDVDPGDRLRSGEPSDIDDEATALRPVLIGGAITSAALSLAGAAFVAWRRTREPDGRRGPMARAVRAARRSRLGHPRPRRRRLA